MRDRDLMNLMTEAAAEATAAAMAHGHGRGSKIVRDSARLAAANVYRQHRPLGDQTPDDDRWQERVDLNTGEVPE